MSTASTTASTGASSSQRRRLRIYLAGMCCLLVLTFGAVAWLQTRQFSLISSAQRYQDDYVVWSLFQFEVDYLKLHQALDQARSAQFERQSAEIATAAELVERRYEIFVSRLVLVEDEHTTRLLQREPDYALTLANIRNFVQWADKLPLSAEHLLKNPEIGEAVLAQMKGLAEGIHGLSLTASHQVSLDATERSDMVRHQARLSLWLTLLQCALTLGLAGLVVHQFTSLLRHAREQKDQAAKLLQAQHAAEAGSRAKSLFLANMSHELRTPMHGLLGMLDLLKAAPLNPVQQAQLKAADDSSHHLLVVLNDILDISKMEAGGISITRQAVNLRSLLGEVEQLSRSQASAGGLTLAVKAEPGLPDWVSTDPTRLRQILLNLIGNAIKFTPSGQVVLHLLRQDGASSPAQWQFQIRDTGIGMDAATMNKLFQRFSQGDDSSSRRYGGSGLGLEISRNLARAMGGDITAQSRLGHGSTFVLSLPLDECPAPDLPAAASPQALSGKSLRILVSEDHPTNQAYLKAVLERLGHHAVFCDNGLETLQRLQQEEGEGFDLVLMDLHTPLMDGYQASQAIRALPGPKAGIKIIALSADAFEESRARALSCGMDDFVAKPVSFEVLVRLLGGQIGLAATSTATTAAPATALCSSLEFEPAALQALRENLPETVVGKLYATYIASLAQTRQALKQACDQCDRDALQAAAHAVKGAAANLGLILVQEPALALEIRAKQTADQGLSTEQAWADLLALTQTLLQALLRSEVLCAEQGLLTRP
ncbi:response regulator [Paucibacter sp. TC2R-5]|uniref:ATP-binding protein n=1 Tax=Paucibacter sp. TC2R-5 TaxID=2893555 RepID=UPI0021E49261|nr:ATP-binding protein [Paucibacter sp. TC2R-5]MCV2357895.1 response regulator [Paucibacter sp. TC2R-5]